jgi:hypothetical protein
MRVCGVIAQSAAPLDVVYWGWLEQAHVKGGLKTERCSARQMALDNPEERW